ncbi:MAG: serine/threonine-protein kinase [Polyangiaceae bacterium]
MTQVLSNSLPNRDAVTLDASQAPREPVPSSRHREDPYLGKTVDGRYRIESVLGEGGMGVVYTARHTVIDKRIAIKVLRGEMAQDKENVDRFLLEARAASSIGNPHIIDISDFGTMPDGATYFVMEHLDGRSLSALLRAEKPLATPRIVAIGKQIARAMAAAHSAGIVHRDMKPDNVMLIERGGQSDFVKILDFGIAKVGSAASQITRAGTVFGTPHYMSPEQAAGTAVDQRSDIYAVGVMLYEMASGRVPFDADNFMGILSQHMHKAPPPIDDRGPLTAATVGLRAVVAKCLAKKPENRYATMDVLAADLECIQRGEMPLALVERRRVPLRLVTTIAILATLLGALGVVFVRSSSAESASPEPAAPTAALPEGPAAPAPLEVPVPIAAPTPAKSESTTVLVGVEPSDARVARGKDDLGTSPIAVDVKKGESVELSFARPGFKAKKLRIDGTQSRVVVRLEANAKPVASPPPAPTVVHPPTLAPGLDYPWK